MNYNKIIEKAGEFVREYMKDHENLNLFYHRLTHTENVITAVTEITQHYKLREKDFFICTIAAWFHDIGYYENGANHEQIGAKKAQEFLIAYGIADETTEAIKKCILATKIPQNPGNFLEQIVCDADLYHFGTDDFAISNKLMRKEAEAMHHIRINKDEWRNSTIALLENHHYWTDYCKNVLHKKKRQNLEKLKKKSGRGLGRINPMDFVLPKA